MPHVFLIVGRKSKAFASNLTHYMLKKDPLSLPPRSLLTSPTPNRSKPEEQRAFLVGAPERGWCKSQ